LQLPAPSQSDVPVQVFGAVLSAPAGIGAHDPSMPVMLQALHAGQLPALQHTPSTQWPSRHSGSLPQVWPSVLRQWPAPSHDCVGSVQVLGVVVSSPIGMAAHVPAPLTLQALQAAHVDVEQHTPSTQLPLRHSLFAAQVLPSALRQWPAPSHDCVGSVQVFGLVVSSPAGMAEQVPMPLRLQALHEAHAATLQQVLSTQLPLRHSPFSVQPAPWLFLQLPAPSHACGLTQVLGAVLSGPAGMGAHVPAPLMLQAWHAGHTADPQQVLSMQLPLVHWLAPVHACPFGFFAVQTEARQ
jgi:hypothetical protein